MWVRWEDDRVWGGDDRVCVRWGDDIGVGERMTECGSAGMMTQCPDQIVLIVVSRGNPTK